jgi:hypothetical protein
MTQNGTEPVVAARPTPTSVAAPAEPGERSGPPGIASPGGDARSPVGSAARKAAGGGGAGLRLVVLAVAAMVVMVRVLLRRRRRRGWWARLSR